jgi:hypothetical protein
MHKRIALKGLLIFTLKQLQHVSVLTPSPGSALFELVKVTVVRIVYFNNCNLASSNNVFPDDGVNTENCWSCFNVNIKQFSCASVGENTLTTLCVHY